MKFKIDENLPVDLAEDLHLAGHDADTIPDENLAGATDLEVTAAAPAPACRDVRRCWISSDRG